MVTDFRGFTHYRYNKTLKGQQFYPVLDLLCKEDLSVGLRVTLSSTEIFLAR